jgi:hypothetical protein
MPLAVKVNEPLFVRQLPSEGLGLRQVLWARIAFLQRLGEQYAAVKARRL